VLDRGRPARGRDIEVGDDERVAIDGVGLGELVERERALVGVQGAPPPGPRIRADLPGSHVEADPADQQPGRGRHQLVV
jgi:hypothetical protein